VSAARFARTFFDALNRHDAAETLAFFAPDSAIDVVPLDLRGEGEDVARRFVLGLLTAFPDLLLRVHDVFGAGEVAIARTTIEGTQAAAFFGVVNQEKHIDVEGAWVLRISNARLIHLRAFWCQNQIYRRLAVKRLDRISILG
jgi:steroid delta-isomerase-like uncharacterized protein